jgi:DNA gyrase subunit B
MIKESEANFTGEDVREGLTAIISVKVPEPQFEGQTKERLGNREVQGITQSVVSEAMSDWLELNPKSAKDIINKVVQARLAREAALKAKNLVRRQSALENSSLPGKFIWLKATLPVAVPNKDAIETSKPFSLCAARF